MEKVERLMILLAANGQVTGKDKTIPIRRFYCMLGFLFGAITGSFVIKI